MLKLFKERQKQFKCFAIIAAAGSSTRMNEYGNKQFIEILDRPLLSYTIEQFENCDLIDGIIIVTKEEDIMYCKNAIVDVYDFKKVTNIIAGGNSRQESVYKGIQELDEDTDIVIVHDGARPLIDIEEIENAIHECLQYDAVSIGVKVIDTIKVVNNDGYVVNTPNRDNMWITQTPQVFKYKLLLNAHINAIEHQYLGTDDAVLVENIGHKVKMIKGKYKNIKVTTCDDLNIVKSYLMNVRF